MVEFDKVLSDTAALGLVGFEDGTLEGTVDYAGDLPAEVKAVLHAYVHALASFGRMGVDSVSGEKDALMCREAGADSLADLGGEGRVSIDMWFI